MKLVTNAIVRKSSVLLMGGMTVAAGWGVYSAGDIFEQMEQMQPGNNPVAISATAPAQNDGAPTLSFTSTSHLRRTAKRGGTASPSLAGDSPASLPTATMNSTSLFAHGSAVAPSGSSSHGTTRSSGGGSSSQMHSIVEDAKRAGFISRGGNMLALSSATTITAPGASNAAAIATMSVNAASISTGPRRDPKDPFLDEEEEEETPVGPIPFAFFTLLAGIYAAVAYRRKKSKQ